MKALTIFLSFFLLNFVAFAGENEKENNAPTALVGATVEPEVSTPKDAEVKKEVINNPPRALSKKEIKAMVKEVKAEMKEARKSGKGPSNWEPNLKIGVTLLVLAILLTFLGIGWVGSLAALAGLFFVIVGLLHTYN